MRILSYNIWDGGGERLQQIGALIRRQAPDAVALQEVSSLSNARALAADLQMELIIGEVKSGFHLAWLSGLPLLQRQNHPLPGLSKTLLEIEVAYAGKSIHLYTTHLASRHDNTLPELEVPEILQVLAGNAGSYHLLSGDFNALAPGDAIGKPPAGVKPRGDAVKGAPRNAVRHLLAAGYVDCFRKLHPRVAGYTYPTHARWLRLDYIFASPELGAELRACEVITGAEAVAASDHFPIQADFISAGNTGNI